MRRKRQRETGVNEEDVGRPSTINSITGYSGGGGGWGGEREEENEREGE